MGHLSLVGMLEVTDTDTALRWHLQYNLLPPPLGAFDFARRAIQRLHEGHGDEPLEDTDAMRSAPSSWAVVESWHLEEFLEESS